MKNGVVLGRVLGLGVVLVFSACATREREVPAFPETLVAEPNPPTTKAAPKAAEQPALAVSGFIDWTAKFDEQETSLSNAYMANGIRRISLAIRVLGGKEKREAAETLAQMANRLEESSEESLARADMVRDAFMASSLLLEGIGMERFAKDAEIQRSLEDLRRAAAALDPREKLLEQRGEVQAFFEAARAAIVLMAER